MWAWYYIIVRIGGYAIIVGHPEAEGKTLVFTHLCKRETIEVISLERKDLPFPLFVIAVSFKEEPLHGDSDHYTGNWWGDDEEMAGDAAFVCEGI